MPSYDHRAPDGDCRTSVVVVYGTLHCDFLDARTCAVAEYMDDILGKGAREIAHRQPTIFGMWFQPHFGHEGHQEPFVVVVKWTLHEKLTM